MGKGERKCGKNRFSKGPLINIWKEAEAGINVEKYQKVSVIFLIVIFPLRLSKASMYGVDVVEQLIDPEAIEPITLIGKGQYDSSDVVHLVNYHHHFAPLLDSKILQENELTAHFNEKF